jgi:hypothetical protein
MSYCRWSIHSDVYAYKSADGFHIHLSGDAGSFHEKTVRGFLDRLMALRKNGYDVPDEAIERASKEDFLLHERKTKKPTPTP